MTQIAMSCQKKIKSKPLFKSMRINKLYNLWVEALNMQTSSKLSFIYAPTLHTSRVH